MRSQGISRERGLKRGLEPKISHRLRYKYCGNKNSMIAVFRAVSLSIFRLILPCYFSQFENSAILGQCKQYQLKLI